MDRWPRYARIGLSAFVLFWVAAAEVSVAVFIYSGAASLGVVPPLRTGPIVAWFTTPTELALVGVVGIATGAVLRYRYGGVRANLAALGRLVDLGESDPVLEGRVLHADTAWLIRYYGGDDYCVVRQGCPDCGRELVEGYLSRNVVNGPNSALDTPELVEEVVDDTLENLTGQRKFEHRDETLALTCPKCNFSIPGEADLEAGRNGALGIFKRHLERMRSGNPRTDPFASYAERVRGRIGGEPHPADLWDEYVAAEAPTDALAFDEDPGRERDGDVESIEPEEAIATDADTDI
jgi:hypothetical protein